MALVSRAHDAGRERGFSAARTHSIVLDRFVLRLW